MKLPWLDKLVAKVQPSGTNILIISAVFVGFATGVGSVVFIALIKYANHIFFGLTDQILAEGLGSWSFKWWLPVIPMVGGFLVGPIVYKFASEARGHGVPEVMNSVARLGGIIRPRVAAAKSIASAICIGSGGSAGREGPIVQIGSAIGSTVGQVFRMSGDRVKILVGCGAAAGISSVFNAPIAGVIFSLEIILGDFAITTFSPVILSSVIASVVTRSVYGASPAFSVPPYSLVSAWEIPMYVGLGIVIGFIGVLFTRFLAFLEDVNDNLKIPDVTKPALGGLLLGIIAVFYPQTLADGYETIKLTLYGQIGISLMVILIFMKLAATSLTLGSGNSGGIFAPALFMGASAGGAYGVLVNHLFPTATANPGAYALVGMAGMVAAATHAPITAMLIIFEMTSDYRIILPLMVTVVFSAMIARRVFPYSIYTVKLARRGIEIRGGKDINVLRSHTISEVMDREFETVDICENLHNIFEKIESTNETYFLVIDKNDHFWGVLSFQDIRSVLSQHTLDYLIIAKDIVHEESVTLNFDDDLDKAFSLFSLQDLKLIPVVDEYNENKVIGVLRREDLVDYYNGRLIETLRR